MRLNASSGKGRQICLGLNVLRGIATEINIDKNDNDVDDIKLANTYHWELRSVLWTSEYNRVTPQSLNFAYLVTANKDFYKDLQVSMKQLHFI